MEGRALKRILGMLLAMAMGGSTMAANRAIPAPYLHRGVSTIYDLYLGGIWAGVLTIDARFGETGYTGESIMRTAGIVGFFYKASFEAEIRGQLGEGGLVPVRFAAASRMQSKEQFVEMLYGPDAAPSAVNATPPFVPKPWQVDVAEQGGTLDPISAALSALAPKPRAEICNRTVDVFDGRRRYAVDIGAPVPDHARIRCPAVYRRISGFKPKLLKKRPTCPFDLWYEERPDGLTHVVRAAGDTMFGIAVVLLRD